MDLRKRLIRDGMAAVLAGTAAVARRPALAGLSDALMRALARASVRAKRIRQAETLADLGRQWQRGFPSAKQVPITQVTADTVFAQIHTPCPLRGSGDLAACHRMMEYDREVLRHAGGQFVVLHSQAEPGRTHCEVAMRRAGAPLHDLKPAHIRTGTPL